MSDFEKVKKNLIETNEKNYGKEIKEEYGEEVYEATNDILGGLTEQQWLDSEQLRMKIEKDPKNPRYIRTLWGKGYRFEGHYS